MKTSFANFTSVGPREINQDRILLPTTVGAGLLFAIADGIGGNFGGEIAAEIALESLKNIFNTSFSFVEAFALVKSEVDEKAASNAKLNRMGTTLSAAFLVNGFLDIAHVGDTRIYQIRGGGLVTLTRDQTETAELLRKGIINRKQARRHPGRNVLTSAIVAGEDFEIFTNEAKLEIGDRLLFLTDGVYEKASKSEISRMSQKNKDIAQFMAELKACVETSSPKDNFSALAFEFEGA